MNSRDFWIPVLIGVIATPVCFLLAAFFSGGGHTIYPMILFFPYGIFLGLLFENLSWWFVGLPIFALQFPLYGIAFGAASVKERFRPLPIGLAVAHFLMVILVMAVEYTRQNQ
ncbi:MAG TPA: hypothetical protein VF543_07645 [Pyrinomonadaceae bacterium]|jgi:hypothetical protein